MKRPSVSTHRLLLTLASLLLIPCTVHGATRTSPNKGLRRERCKSVRHVTTLVTPSAPTRNKPVRIIIASTKPYPNADIEVVGPSSELIQPTTIKRGAGPPYWWVATVAQPSPGRYQFKLTDDTGATLACRKVRVSARPTTRAPKPGDDVWPVLHSWSRRTERLYAVWIESLFDAPPQSRPSWKPLHQLLRDPQRNILYNHLGYTEDGPHSNRAVVAKPDCADLPYYLRAYFAWKLRLPFGYRHCDRGSSRRPARCKSLRTNVDELILGETDRPAQLFSRFLRRKVSYVHSGSGRTAPDDDASDLYPVRLTRDGLAPGTVYVDPYGHLLIVAKWILQTPTASGAMYAADGHPDLSVGRKRFWKGAFLFSSDTRGGAGGFKAFRPLVLREGTVVALTNEEIQHSRHFRTLSTQQYRLGDDGFYERMDEVINPDPLSPKAAYSERLKAFYELVQERVDAVAAGEQHMQQTDYASMPMPEGPRIFETQGDWENFSTPARDLRLLIALDEVVAFPERVERSPKRFALATGQNTLQMQKALQALYTSFCDSHHVRYRKSDGSFKELSLSDIIERATQLEVAYNPNDCVELRWGATGDELKTCTRRAPEEQLERMRKYRPWFATRRRPPIR